MSSKIQWSAIPPDLNLKRMQLPYKADELQRGGINYPRPDVIPLLQYVNISTPPFSTEERPFTCPSTDLLKLDHLHNPMIILGQPFSGKSCLFMKLSSQAYAHYGTKHWIRMIDLRVAALNCIARKCFPTDILEFFAIQLNVATKSVQDLFKPLANSKELMRKKKYEKLIKGELFLDGFDEIPPNQREYFLKLLPQLRKKRRECPIRVWISSRSYFKARLLNLMGDESAFQIMDYDMKLQKELLFLRFKTTLFPNLNKLKRYEEQRLMEYTEILYKEFCKEIQGFESTFGTAPFYLEVIASIFANHADNFLALYRKYREDEKARKKNKSGRGREEEGEIVEAPSTQILCQIAGMFTAEFMEYLAFTAVDNYCLKYLYNRQLSEPEYRLMLEREYRRVTHFYAEYAIKTFPTYQYETLVPRGNPASPEMVPNLKLIIDQELHHVGFMVMGPKDDGLVELRHKILGDFFLAKHYACAKNMEVRDPQFDTFFLRVLLFEAESKNARGFYDNILYSSNDYRPTVLRNFLREQYCLDPGKEVEWECIRNDGTAWHMAVMEGFHRIALNMLNCFNPVTEREYIRKLLKMRVPMETFEGTRESATLRKVAGTHEKERHLVSSLSLVAMFLYGGSMEEFLKVFFTFFTKEEIYEELSAPDAWTPLHWACTHTNLWFIMYMYNQVFIPVQYQPPPGRFTPAGQLPMHLTMKYYWCHYMVVKDYFHPKYDTLSGCEEALKNGAGCCGTPGAGDDPNHHHFREIVCFRDMTKDTHGPGNLLRLVHHECIRLMVKIGGEDVNVQERLTGRTILHYASLDGCLETVKFLLDLNAWRDLKDKDGKTPLHIAADGGSLEIVRELLVAGANTEIKDKDQRTALHYAALGGHRKIFMCLVKNRANATCKDRFGTSPITLWTQFGSDIDKVKNEPMCKEDMHFFRACEDIDKMIQNARNKERQERSQREEAEKMAKERTASGGEGEEELADGEGEEEVEEPSEVEGEVSSADDNEPEDDEEDDDDDTLKEDRTPDGELATQL